MLFQLHFDNILFLYYPLFETEAQFKDFQSALRILNITRGIKEV